MTMRRCTCQAVDSIARRSEAEESDEPWRIRLTTREPTASSAGDALTAIAEIATSVTALETWTSTGLRPIDLQIGEQIRPVRDFDDPSRRRGSFPERLVGEGREERFRRVGSFSPHEPIVTSMASNRSFLGVKPAPGTPGGLFHERSW